MTTLTVEEAQAQLSRLLEELRPGEVITITRDAKPLARLTGVEERPKAGSQAWHDAGVRAVHRPGLRCPFVARIW